MRFAVMLFAMFDLRQVPNTALVRTYRTKGGGHKVSAHPPAVIFKTKPAREFARNQGEP
jgi:hypothetical protein